MKKRVASHVSIFVSVEEEWSRYFRCWGCGEKNSLPVEIDEEKYKCHACGRINMVMFDKDEDSIEDSDEILDDGEGAVDSDEEENDTMVGE